MILEITHHYHNIDIYNKGGHISKMGSNDGDSSERHNLTATATIDDAKWDGEHRYCALIHHMIWEEKAVASFREWWAEFVGLDQMVCAVDREITQRYIREIVYVTYIWCENEVSCSWFLKETYLYLIIEIRSYQMGVYIISSFENGGSPMTRPTYSLSYYCFILVPKSLFLLHFRHFVLSCLAKSTKCQ